jgi:hypothetical protein
MKKKQVFYWVWEIRAGGEYLSDEGRPRRPYQLNIDTLLAQKLELNRHTMAEKPALSLDVLGQTMTNHLHHNLEMKCYHLRWIPHVLDDSQQAERVRCARIMFEALDVHVRTNNQYFITEDEAWMIYNQIPLI